MEVFEFFPKNFSLKKIIIDLEDWERVKEFDWYFDKLTEDVSAFRYTGAGYLSRFILGIEDPGILVDHKNGNKFDNRKENLRTCTKSQNAANSGPRSYKYKGVTYNKINQNWNAQIKILYKKKHLGSFATIEEAARAYDSAAKKHFGEFAKLNFPK